VPNPQFEDHTSCDFSISTFDHCSNWFLKKGSADFYHACDSSGADGTNVPTNSNNGSQNSLSGEGMIGFFASERIYGPDIREYVHVRLLQKLDSGQNYYVQFYVNLNESSHYAVESIGAYISDSLTGWAGWQGARFNVTPQIVNQTGALLDSTGWMKISGWFQSKTGEEEYLTIGNFFTDSQSGIANINSTSMGRSYYFVDDVCISLDSAFCELVTTKIDPILSEEFRVFPNPTHGIVKIEMESNESVTVQLYSITGERLYERKDVSVDELELDASQFAGEVFILHLVGEDSMVKKKIVKYRQ